MPSQTSGNLKHSLLLPLKCGLLMRTHISLQQIELDYLDANSVHTHMLELYEPWGAIWEETKCNPFFHVNWPYLFFTKYGQNRPLELSDDGIRNFADDWYENSLNFNELEWVSVMIAHTTQMCWQRK
jgi:hypothetical protein